MSNTHVDFAVDYFLDIAAKTPVFWEEIFVGVAKDLSR